MVYSEFTDLDEQITCVDTGLYRRGLAACYLVEQDGQAAFVDTGTTRTVPRLLHLLEAKGLTREDVAYVIPTHVHLDHAGGAGELMRQCPNARLVVHPKGAPHMIDPSRLAAGATAVYGEDAFARDFGELVPVPEGRVVEAADGLELELNGRALTFIDTPGHANHHFCVLDGRSGGVFTGDTFGISYRELDTALGPFIFAPTTPVAFDPAAWEQSLDRLLGLEPAAMYLTHYGRVTGVKALAERLRASIRRFARIAGEESGEKAGRKGRIKDRVEEELLSGLRDHGSELAADHARELLAHDLELNAQGLEVWLVRQEKRAQGGGTG